MCENYCYCFLNFNKLPVFVSESNGFFSAKKKPFGLAENEAEPFRSVNLIVNIFKKKKKKKAERGGEKKKKKKQRERGKKKKIVKLSLSKSIFVSSLRFEFIWILYFNLIWTKILRSDLGS